MEFSAAPDPRTSDGLSVSFETADGRELYGDEAREAMIAEAGSGEWGSYEDADGTEYFGAHAAAAVLRAHGPRRLALITTAPKRGPRARASRHAPVRRRGSRRSGGGSRAGPDDDPDPELDRQQMIGGRP